MKALYFTAVWCGPCKQFKPLFKRVADELGVDYVEVDVDENEDLALKYMVMSVPSVVMLVEDTEVDRITGAFPEPLLRKRIGAFVG